MELHDKKKFFFMKENTDKLKVPFSTMSKKKPQLCLCACYLQCEPVCEAIKMWTICKKSCDHSPSQHKGASSVLRVSSTGAGNLLHPTFGASISNQLSCCYSADKFNNDHVSFEEAPTIRHSRPCMTLSDTLRTSSPHLVFCPRLPRAPRCPAPPCCPARRAFPPALQQRPWSTASRPLWRDTGTCLNRWAGPSLRGLFLCCSCSSRRWGPPAARCPPPRE